GSFGVSEQTQVAPTARTAKRQRRGPRDRARPRPPHAPPPRSGGTPPRSIRRHAQSPRRLPAVTPYGTPRLHVKAAYVFDATNNRVLFQKNSEQVLPIASLTKLTSAIACVGTT